MSFTSPDVEIVKFVTKVEGIDEVIETPVSGADKVSVKIPESSNYVMTIHFKAKTDLKDFRYKQVVKRKGITVKNREVEIGDYAASDEVYSKEFPQDSTPGGFLIRGVYNAKSNYQANGKDILIVEWELEIVSKA
ncbi:hypothetical protein PGUG_00487 [Meyerozyma guilliermondii ATCC 6260]|uniref:Rho GDP-dissociation inhibitor n=1 Tax=Meyerozyma guilliermondii (strain ATCC 6260 / CBS 566 / DSM 6381 / JCM 1539 / NBRC 10279 / NRRL Y-324) TaxID=294746 RepID=A5DB32_PICGU|nr:uncharacterized protein PGUG_00487 [Meyerozyma guilliermondii ATCC 6260]EDK36389.2 hypothetical protein PGUG_00487 [Meyerozyma guilliermondii ATCC 6260]